MGKSKIYNPGKKTSKKKTPLKKNSKKKTSKKKLNNEFISIDSLFKASEIQAYKKYSYDNIESIEKKKGTKSFLYSDLFNHVYLYNEINNETVDDAITELNNLKRLQEHDIVDDFGNIQKVYSLPKPVALHLNSPGGSTNAGVALANYVTNSEIPIIVLGEGIIASAATFVLVSARLSYIMENTIILIHQFFGIQSGKFEELKFEASAGDLFMKMMIDMYINNTKLSKTQLRTILYRDLYISSTDAIKWGLANHLIKEDYQMDYFIYDKRQFQLYDPAGFRIGNTFTNTISLLKDQPDVESYNEFNKSLSIVKYIHSLNYYLNSIPLYITFTDMIGFDFFTSMLELIPVINALAISSTPAYGIVRGPIRNYSVILLINLKRRYMHETANIVIDFLTHQEPAYKFKDVLKNTEFTRAMITNYFKKRTKLPKKVIDNLFNEKHYFDAKYALKYGLIDEIIDTEYL